MSFYDEIMAEAQETLANLANDSNETLAKLANDAQQQAAQQQVPQPQQPEQLQEDDLFTAADRVMQALASFIQAADQQTQELGQPQPGVDQPQPAKNITLQVGDGTNVKIAALKQRLALVGPTGVMTGRLLAGGA